MLKLKDFFEIGTNNIPVQKPINRNAFTAADIAYKLKCIKAMQDLGMVVTIDKIGNICGTIPGKLLADKSIICGSHTDSVDNGGQFDGPLGVYAALKTAENIINSGKQNLVNYKAIIYACEESTRFKGKACLGSKFLRGDHLDFDAILSRDGISLRECITQFKTELFKEIEKNGLKSLIEVDRVIEQGEIISAIEGHIEQADVLRENNKNIGICTSIVAPYRLKANISDIETAAKFICRLNETARKEENLQKYRVTIPEFSIKNPIAEADLQNKKIIAFRSIGENNHSGATPVNKRKDAVYGAAKFIELLSGNPAVQFLETCTPSWGANQINDCCEVKLAIDSDAPRENILQLLLAQIDASKIANVQLKSIHAITKQDKESGLFLDIRQQISMNSKLSSEMIFETAKDIVHKTKSNVYMNITAKGEPYETHPDLIKTTSQICESKQIPYQTLNSWAGHDLQTLTYDENARTILLFCDNSGGSHNPKETTSVDAIHKLVEVESSLAKKELERANQVYLQSSYQTLQNELLTVQELSKEFGVSLENQKGLEERE